MLWTAAVVHDAGYAPELAVTGLAAALDEFPDEGPTVVRDALWWADMTVGPDGIVVGFEERMAEVRRRYCSDRAVSRAVDASLPGRAEAVRRTEVRLRAAGVQV